MMVGSLAVLFAGSLSPKVETVAMFVQLPGMLASTVSVMVLLLLGASGLLFVQVTI